MSSESVQQVAGEVKDAHQKAVAERIRLTGEPEKAGTDTGDDRCPAERAHGASGSSAAIQQVEAGVLKGGHPGWHAGKKGKKSKAK